MNAGASISPDASVSASLPAFEADAAAAAAAAATLLGSPPDAATAALAGVADTAKAPCPTSACSAPSFTPSSPTTSDLGCTSTPEHASSSELATSSLPSSALSAPHTADSPTPLPSSFFCAALPISSPPPTSIVAISTGAPPTT